jgi:LAO/AO transport system kinase
LSDRVLAGDHRAIARAISLVENGDPAADLVLAAVAERTGRAFVVGVTGPPGAGKSTLVDRLTARWRARGRQVGVLAVDPSSPFSGGALLGDRVRMQAHAGDAGVFIRSMATRGATGGVARATRDAARVLEAAGFDPIVIETVGVGQAEVDVVSLADVVIVVVVPGTGDDIQALKAGVMEAGDVFVVNKADRDGAELATAAIQSMLALDQRGDRPWPPRVLTAVATAGQGLDELFELLFTFEREAEAVIQARRARRAPAGARTGLALDHIGIAAHDAATILEFLETSLGLVGGVAEDLPAAGVRVRFLEARGAALEIVEPLGDQSPVARFLAARGPGLHHVAFRVDDLRQTLVQLRARGVRLIDDVPRPGAHGAQIAFIHPSSAGGILVELVERNS